MIVKDKLHKDVLAWEVEIEDLNIDVENLDYKLQEKNPSWWIKPVMLG